MSVASRFCFVSSRFALMTHQIAVRRYYDGWAWKKSHASGRSARATAAHRWPRAGGRHRPVHTHKSPDRSSARFANAASPAGRIRPCAVSSSTRLMLTALQVLRGLRDANRIT